MCVIQRYRERYSYLDRVYVKERVREVEIVCVYVFKERERERERGGKRHGQRERARERARERERERDRDRDRDQVKYYASCFLSTGNKLNCHKQNIQY
jgi:hypothetical protein